VSDERDRIADVAPFSGRGLSARDALSAPLNTLRFHLRRAIGFRRGPPELRQEPKDALFDYLDGRERRSAEERERELRKRYRLGPLAARSTRLDYRDNLYLLDALEQIVEGEHVSAPTREVSVVDVGSKNFSYAFALDRFFRHHRVRTPREVSLLGVEIDGHVIYRDWRSRCDYAEAYLKQTENPRARYRVADFCALDEGSFDVVTLFFPFVTRHALVRWGLPLRLFEPQRLIDKAARVAPRGWLVALSQTEEERDALVDLLAGTRAHVVRSRRIESKLVSYFEDTNDRWGTVAAIDPGAPDVPQ
jgi:hypothetical protein